MTARRGQVAVFLVFVLVAITVLTLMNAGAFLAVRAKNRAMNAGDAAAIAAARRQAELLNEIGRLNLRHAEADWVGDWERGREIVREQQRLCFLGPLDCFRAANEAARDNRAASDGCWRNDIADTLSRHAATVRSVYAENPDLYPEPWDGAWELYASALSALAGEENVAGCDNIEFYDAIECFPITSKSFYSMVEGEAWCKLVVAGWTGLLNIDLHNLPQPGRSETSAIVNSEICSLHLKAMIPPPMDAGELDEFRALLARNGAKFPEGEGGVQYPAKDDRAADDLSRVYFFYDESRWCAWSPFVSRANLPIAGTIKSEFDVRGCSCIFRTFESVPQLISGGTRIGTWNAAAKPFGTIETSHGRSIVTHDEARGMVLPAFEAVRLVPIALADCGNDLSTADKAWLDHVREHVPRLFDSGADALSPECRYCRTLLKWNDPEFRSRVDSWVQANAETCRRGSGGSGSAGGTSYAH